MAERVGFETTQAPIEISNFMKYLRLCVSPKPLLSPLLAVAGGSRPTFRPLAEPRAG